MKDLGTRTLETRRLILRRFILEDAGQMYQNWATDPKVTRYLTWSLHKNMEETRSVIQNWIDGYRSNGYDWVVQRKEDGVLIGAISCVSVSRRNHNCEVGYCYGSRFWNQGYGSEALEAVLQYLLEECEMHLVTARHDSLNPASGRVMEKAGMIREAVLKEQRYHSDTDSYSDLICYRKTR